MSLRYWLTLFRFLYSKQLTVIPWRQIVYGKKLEALISRSSKDPNICPERKIEFSVEPIMKYFAKYFCAEYLEKLLGLRILKLA